MSKYDNLRVVPTPAVMKCPDIRLGVALSKQMLVKDFSPLLRLHDNIRLNKDHVDMVQTNAVPAFTYEDKTGIGRYPQSMYRGTAVIAGSGPSRNSSTLSKLAEAGAYIFALGYGIDTTTPAHAWVTVHDPTQYPGFPFICPGMQKFVSNEYKDSKLWDSIRKQFTTHIIDTPGVVFVDPEYSSLLQALRIASGMGFRSVVLTGISLKARVDEMHYFPDLPSKAHVEERQERYEQLHRQLPAIIDTLYRQNVTVVTTDLIEDLDIPVLPGKDIATAITRQLLQGVTIRQEYFVGENILTFREQEDLNRQIGKANLYEHIETFFRHLWEDSPEIFTEEHKQRIPDLFRKLENPKGCKGCTLRNVKKNFLGILKEVRDDPGVQAKWKLEYPEHFVIIHDKEYVFRSDHLETERKWKQMQK